MLCLVFNLISIVFLIKHKPKVNQVHYEINIQSGGVQLIIPRSINIDQINVNVTNNAKNMRGKIAKSEIRLFILSLVLFVNQLMIATIQVVYALNILLFIAYSSSCYLSSTSIQTQP